MEILETTFLQSSPTHEGEKDVNYLQNNAIEKLSQGLELDQTTNVDGCATKKICQYYFIKFWPYEDQNVKSKIKEAEKLIEQINKKASPITEKYWKRVADSFSVLSQLGRLYNSKRRIKQALVWNTDNLDYLRVAVGKLNLGLAFQMLHKTNNLATERNLLREIKESLAINKSQQRGTVDSFSSVEDFRVFIQIQLLYRILQFSNEDKIRNKWVLKEIQELERVEEKAITDATLKGKIWNPLGSRKSIEERIRLIYKISEELEKQSVELRAEIENVKKDLNVVDKDIMALRRQCDDVRRRKAEVDRHILNLRRQQDKENDRYSRYVSVMSNARELARKKDVKALEELSRREVHIFMSKWNRSEAFRSYYEKSILPSLGNRQLSRDGRIRNLSEGKFT